MTTLVHCDYAGCDSVTPPDNLDDWLMLTTTDGVLLDFCSPLCVENWAAMQQQEQEAETIESEAA